MYIYHLQMTMFLHFAWEHVAELQVQHRQACAATGRSTTLYTTTISTSMDHRYRDGDR